MVKSEEIAIDILKNYNIKFWIKNDSFKFKHREIVMCAELRNISMLNYLYDAEVTLDDIIERNEESKYQKIKNIDEYNYCLNVYTGNGSLCII